MYARTSIDQFVSVYAWYVLFLLTGVNAAERCERYLCITVIGSHNYDNLH